MAPTIRPPPPSRPDSPRYPLSVVVARARLYIEAERTSTGFVINGVRPRASNQTELATTTNHDLEVTASANEGQKFDVQDVSALAVLGPAVSRVVGASAAPVQVLKEPVQVIDAPVQIMDAPAMTGPLEVGIEVG